MRNLTRSMAVGLACLMMAGQVFADTKDVPEKAKAEKAQAKSAVIQMAILLDTSNSMDGLINQARSQLWKVVNEFATARRNGKVPNLRVALYQYGNSTLSKDTNWIQQVLPFSDDLDRVSEKLFALTTNGGQEYCGAVIQHAVSELQWSKSNDDLKCIFIAGNEPFSQGPVSYQEVCKTAIEKGITVSTIFCGNEAQGVQTGWQAGALLADGSFMNIDQNKVVVAIATPQDTRLAELSGKLNRTYLAYGSVREQSRFLRNQIAQDSNAAKSAPAAAAGRATAKASGLYRNARNDLVDAFEAGKLDLKKIPKDQLPKEFKGLSEKECNDLIKKKQAERKKLQSEIKELTVARNKYIAEERSKSGDESGATLDEAIVKAVRKQATKKKFVFEAPKTPAKPE